MRRRLIVIAVPLLVVLAGLAMLIGQVDETELIMGRYGRVTGTLHPTEPGVLQFEAVVPGRNAKESALYRDLVNAGWNERPDPFGLSLSKPGPRSIHFWSALPGDGEFRATYLRRETNLEHLLRRIRASLGMGHKDR
jgi:hypothetical protein